MFIIIYDSQTKAVISFKWDRSTVPNISIEQEIIWNANGNPNAVGEIIEPITEDIVVGKHLFDTTTKTLLVNPNWKEPALPKVSVQGIPSTDTSTGTTVHTP